MQHFCFPDLGKEKLCSVLVFGIWECMFHYSSPDKSWQCCEQGGCWTFSHHCQIADKNPSKRWNGKFRGFRICDGFPQRDFVLWVLCARLISVYFVSILCLFCLFSLFSGYHAAGYHAPSIPHGLSRLYHHYTATTLDSFPATTPKFFVLFLGYHTWAITLHHTRTSGYHTRHS